MFRILGSAFAALGLTAGMLANAPAHAAVRAGTLACNEAGGWGLVFGSSHDIRCTFSLLSGRVDRYVGKISEFATRSSNSRTSSC